MGRNENVNKIGQADKKGQDRANISDSYTEDFTDRKG